jgi:hypothetical protein
MREQRRSEIPEPDTLALRITPIPKPLYRINLRSVLKASEWKAIRQSLIRERGLICQSCGEKVLSADLQEHEQWTYDTSSEEAVATLTGIAIQCRMCHDCEHFFRILLLFKKGLILDDRITNLIDHFCKVNSTTTPSFNRHAISAWNEWKRLSGLRWQVILRPYSDRTIFAEPSSVSSSLEPTSAVSWADPSGS